MLRLLKMFGYVFFMVIFVVLNNRPLLSAQRSILCEEFTAVTCGVCPGAAQGLHELKDTFGDTVIIIGYHPYSSDPFYKYEAWFRGNLFYDIPGTPTVYFDGIDSVIGGLPYGYSMYPSYKPKVEERKNIPSPVYFALSCLFDPVSDSGLLTVKVVNDTDYTISAKLRIALVLRDTPYYWQGMSHLEWVFYDMLPTINGQNFTLSPGDTFVYIQDFSIPPDIANISQVQFVVFAQNDITHEVLNSWYINYEDFSFIEEKNSELFESLKLKIYSAFGEKIVKLYLPEDGKYVFTVFDLSGRKVFEKCLYGKGFYQFKFSKSGIYFYTIRGKRNLSGKIIVK